MLWWLLEKGQLPFAECGHNRGMNELKVNQQQTIAALHEQGWSKCRIAREIGMDRKTVRRYLAKVGTAKSPGNPQTGSLLGRGRARKFV